MGTIQAQNVPLDRKEILYTQAASIKYGTVAKFQTGIDASFLPLESKVCSQDLFY